MKIPWIELNYVGDTIQNNKSKNGALQNNHQLETKFPIPKPCAAIFNGEKFIDVDVPQNVQNNLNFNSSKSLHPFDSSIQSNSFKAVTVLWSENFDASTTNGAIPAGWSRSPNSACNVATWGNDYGNNYITPNSGNNYMWCNGKCWNGDYWYNNNQDNWLIYGPFDLSCTTEADLDFMNRFRTETNFDYINYYVSVDGTNYYGWQNSGDGWSTGFYNTNFDLTTVPTIGNICGQSSVYVAFRLTSDGSTTKYGWYLDDVVLTKTCTNPTAGTITGAPASICAGSNITYTYSGGSCGTLNNFQTQWDGTGGTWTDQGSTNPYVWTASNPGHTLYVRAKVVNGSCTSYSAVVSTVINANSVAPTSISGTNPVCSGSTTSLTASGGTTGTGAIYKWYSGGCGTTLVGTGVTWVTPAIGADITYYVRLEGTCNITSCASSLIVVNTAVSITTQPTGSTVCEGGMAAFSVITSGTGVTYQWRKGGVIIGGATSSTYVINPVILSHAGSYDVVCTTACGSVTSTAVTLTVNAVSVAATSASAATNPVCNGSPTTLSIAGGTLGTAAAWTWYSGSCGGTLVGTGSSLAVSPTTATTYYVRAEGTCNTTACVNTGLVNVNAVTSISGHPADQTFCAGNSTTFSVSAAGTALTYQWQYSADGSSGWANVVNATPVGSTYTNPTTTTLTVAFTSASAANSHYYRCVVSGTCGVVNSNKGTLTLQSLSVVPTSASAAPAAVCSGASSTLSVTGGSLGSGAVWTWYSGSCGGTSVDVGASVIVSPIVSTTYYVRAEGTCNTTTCVNNTVTINTAPAITGQPSSQSVCIPTGTTFTVAATGAGLTYQWQLSTDGGNTFNNITVGGSNPTYSNWTTVTLTLSNNTVVGNNNYKYRCVITGTCGNATSTAATLTANTSSTNPTGAAALPTTICNGGSSVLTVSGGSIGSGASWLWYTVGCGTTLAGAGVTLTVSPVATTQYWVRASGYCNTTTCQTVTVTVSGTALPTPNAGIDQYICSASATMDGSAPTAGVWTLVSGPNTPAITLNTNPVTTITGLVSGTYVFRWTDTVAGGCTGYDDVVIFIQ